jgi:hypothetical protein
MRSPTTQILDLLILSSLAASGCVALILVLLQ